jgi:hypothetical protein
MASAPTLAAAMAASAALAAPTAPPGAGSAEFVRSYAAATPNLGQIPRWADELCVQAAGLTVAQATPILERIQAVARLTGQRQGGERCANNITILFSDSPQALIDNLAAKDERILGYYHHIEFNRLKTMTRPIQAWYMTATRGTGGVAGGLFSNNGRVERDRPDIENLDDPEAPVPTGCSDNRFSHCLRSVFVHALVVVDNRRIAGLEPELVADYVTMLVFSQPASLDRCAPLPSIIDLFADCPERPKPQGLTSADRAYLVALYRSNPEAKLQNQQSEIAEKMDRTLAGTRSE